MAMLLSPEYSEEGKRAFVPNGLLGSAFGRFALQRTLKLRVSKNQKPRQHAYFTLIFRELLDFTEY